MPLTFVLFAGAVGLATIGWVTGKVIAAAQRRRSKQVELALPEATVHRESRPRS